MARINLLPWREQLREERKKRYLATLGGVFLVAAGLVFLGSQLLNSAIDNQQARNRFIQTEIATLDARIKEISELRARRQQLLERMKIIQDLQGNRPITGRIFDQLVRTLPDGVHFQSVSMTGQTIAINGFAESNSRVSTLMRNLDQSDWMASPNLTEVKAVSNRELDKENEFHLTVQQVLPEQQNAEAGQ